MKNLLSFSLLSVMIALSSCQSTSQPSSEKTKEKTQHIAEPITEHITEHYQLYLPAEKPEAVLILFGGYPQYADDVIREFEPLSMVEDHPIALVILNYNQRLWLEEEDKRAVAKMLQNLVEEHELPAQNLYMGGYSSGGNMSLLIGNYIVGMKEFYIDPKGIFFVDSPMELSALYASSLKNIARDFSVPSVQESTWIIETLGNRFGPPTENIEKYEAYSIYTLSTDNTQNLKKLKDVKLRFYTEPDTAWWKENRMADPDQMNAYYIERLAKSLQKKGYQHVEYIPTKNKGYRANGDRHPHSWSIVDKEDLVDWILEE